jgi:hypothetical protein
VLWGEEDFVGVSRPDGQQGAGQKDHPCPRGRFSELITQPSVGFWTRLRFNFVDFLRGSYEKEGQNKTGNSL